MVYTYYYSTGRNLPQKLTWLRYLTRNFSHANILALRILSVKQTTAKDVVGHYIYESSFVLEGEPNV